MMRIAAVSLLTVFLCTYACPKSKQNEQNGKAPAEAEIRAILCDISKRDYAAAQNRVERVLESDPANIYAQKLLPLTIYGQIKPGDKSTEGIAIVRRAIEAYRRASNNPRFSSEERAQADEKVLALYSRVSEEEVRNELLKRGLDPNRTPKERSKFYTLLATKFWSCSYDVTSRRTAPSKLEAKQARECASRGLSYANQALTLDEDNGSAWSYKTNLLKDAATLAALNNDRAGEAEYQNRYH